LGNAGAVVPEQAGNHFAVAGVDERIAHLFADRLPYRNRQLVLERAIEDDLDQVLVVKDVAMRKDWEGDLDFVVGEGAA